MQRCQDFHLKVDCAVDKTLCNEQHVTTYPFVSASIVEGSSHFVPVSGHAMVFCTADRWPSMVMVSNFIQQAHFHQRSVLIV